MKIGAVCDSPNHNTERKAQHTAGNVNSTMIQLSKKISTLRLSPIARPSARPITIEMTKPSKIRASVCPDHGVGGRIAVDLEHPLDQQIRPGKEDREEEQRDHFPDDDAGRQRRRTRQHAGDRIRQRSSAWSFAVAVFRAFSLSRTVRIRFQRALCR